MAMGVLPTKDEYDRFMNVLLKAVFSYSRAAVRALDTGGCIVQIASVLLMLFAAAAVRGPLATPTPTAPPCPELVPFTAPTARVPPLAEPAPLRTPGWNRATSTSSSAARSPPK